jgi:PGF-pre-PGF domain-containing protein
VVVEIIEGVTKETAVEIIKEVTTEKAAAIITEMTTETAGNIIEKVTTDTAVDIVGKVTTETAVDIISDVVIETAADIVTRVAVEKAAAVMEELPTQKLNDTIPEMNETALTERLPGMSAEKLYDVKPAVLFDSLPNAPTEQLVGEVAPVVLEGLDQPEVLRVTSDGEEYLAIKTVEDEWVVVMATPAPLEQLMIKTKRALENVKTIVGVFEKQPAEIAVSLPAEQTVRAYVAVSFENAVPEDIEIGHMNFYVEKDWLKQNSIHKWSVVLNRYDSALKQWVPLPTKRVKEDDSRMYYSVTITQFSIFAISGSESLPSRNFEASNFNLDLASIKGGEPVTISADITNLSDKAGIFVATLWIDNTIETGKNISLKGKETTALSFTVTRNIEGSFEVRLDRLFGSFSVTEAAPAPAPTETPPVDQSFNWWLVGSIVAGCIVAGLLGYFFIWRKRGLPLAKTWSAKAVFGTKKAVIRLCRRLGVK